MDRDTMLWVAGGLIAAAVVAAILLMLFRRNQRRRLREEFGPEYERTVDRYGDRGRAETDLQQRKERVAKLSLRPLATAERSRFSEEWRRIQTRFVDDPSASIREADALVSEVMRTRGYPVENVSTQTSDLSVLAPALVENYRSAHDIFLRNEQHDADTEDLRRALVHYRGVFTVLLEEAPISRVA